MTTREAQGEPGDDPTDDEIEGRGMERSIDERDYPLLATVWDNDDDSIFDEIWRRRGPG